MSYNMGVDRAELFDSIEKNVAFSFSRSGGAGGQNVNKVNTKVRASVPFAALKGLSQSERTFAHARLKNAVNADGLVFVEAEDERFQERNRAIALGRLKTKIAQAALVPKTRKKTKPTKAAKEKRLLDKKLRGRLKALRRERF